MDLLERDHERGVIGAALVSAAAGQGAGVAVVGDAGAGKSALLGSTYAADGLRVLRGGCDPLRTPRPLGPFRDVAGEAGFGPLLHGEGASLAHVCDELYDALRTRPTVLVVEDLHWVDAASVDVLRFLARRVGSMPLALLVSYRDHEIGLRHPVRPLLGDLARLDGLTTLHLSPLSVAGVGQLVAGTGLDADKVHAITGGNPFFVTEVAKDPGRPLPVSVRDAVLARTVDVDPEDLEVLQLVATAPDRLDDRVLPALGVDLPTLRRLEATGLLDRARGGLVFRHELARQALESTIPGGGAPRLHARVLDGLERIGTTEPAVLTHHAVAARDADRAVRYARAAAEEAIRAGSHTEAADFFRTALDHLDDAPPAERAELLLRLSFEQYMTSRLTEAIETVRATFPLWRDAGSDVGLAAAHETCAVYEYYNARRHRAEALVDRAADIAAEIGRGTGTGPPTGAAADPAQGTAWATRAFLAYMRNDVDRARRGLDDAARVAATGDHAQLALRTDLVRSLTALVEGDVTARGRLTDQVEAARAHGWDELASTGYSQLASLDVEQRRLRAAEQVLDASLPFTVERDIPICRHWQTAVRSRLHFAQGHWGAALEDAEDVLEREGMPVARLWPQLVAALVPLREGGTPPRRQLDTAWELASEIDEPMRRLPVLSALAESMWMTGETDPRVTEDAVREVARAADTTGMEWGVGDLAAWLVRLGLLDAWPAQVAEPFRMSAEGRAEEAASWWQRAGDSFNAAMALGDSTDPAHRTRAVEMLDQLGAGATADRQRVVLRADGVGQVPPRPRESTRANPSGLTNRQLDVARLVARGFTNAEIAARLYISPKTADHHVSAVLAKMGLSNRRAVMVRAEELGLV
ncbi:helix-turn-helix transcriptional regulator [Nocardioides guangzhouensis]|uniref:Helix-turn-helix transcriptional regulator n=1 Tax=Nocardioides guangzhouensis TaxID=2497878 RepID=A0A4Q4ZCY1_9ACTN|nr:AAA family ATPase [Nocardioides guangzhouensis]RYP85853.1 helix-turn-helix transcriptional regulator [Nocardioides guangzhouensis]